jgi:hypothetical protein
MIDGDLASIVVPSPSYAKIWEDPLGLKLIGTDLKKASPNRFFVHATMAEYFRTVPIMLHAVTNPIDSVYLSIAIAKTLIQIFIILLLAAFISNSARIFRSDFLLAAVLTTPLMQTDGFTRTMGIIDVAPTYAFFYALPLSLLMSFFYFFYKLDVSNESFKLNNIHKIYLLFLVLYLPLNGPLIPGVVLVICPSILLYKWMMNFKEQREPSFTGKIWAAFRKLRGIYIFYFTLFSILSLYSLYIGRHDSENISTVTLLERYKRLPIGLFNILTQKPGLPLLIIVIIINIYIINKKRNLDESQQILRIFKIIGILAAIYLFLLPFGGYRSYRENIIRYDTFMPVTLSLMFIYALSSCYLLKIIEKDQKIIIATVLFLVSLFFTIADKSIIYKNCEQEALIQISNSKEKIVPLDFGCTIMSWNKITDPEYSRVNCQLLEKWGIIKESKLYYQK